MKYLRVLEQIPRPWSAHRPWSGDGIPGQMVAVSLYTHIWIAVLQGVVPVEADGSALFRVPAGKNLYFQALDENFEMIQGMRTFVHMEPGESRSCIGCHEHRHQAPAAKAPLALRRLPVQLGPQPGETAPRPLYYPTDVQTVLDRRCVECHNDQKKDGDVNLSARLTEHFNVSYEELLEKGYVKYIQEWTGKKSNGSMDHAEAVPPYTYGSPASRLMQILHTDHYGVRLSREEHVKLATWIDCNAPFYGSYFGRRNLAYQKRPDFRPVPTLESARGVPPPATQYEPPAVAAELIAHWPLDEGRGNVAIDATGHGHEGRIAGSDWTRRGNRSALALEGKQHVAIRDLGTFDTISVALWVKAGALKNTWSPLLFTDGWQLASFHFSLLTDGAVNLAVNNGRAVHMRSHATVSDGAWHHVAVVADLRCDGAVRFYVDGRLDQRLEPDLDVPVLLDSMRVGAWNRWEGQANNNFHGALGDVRVYRGLLSEAQVAKLADIRK